MAAPSYQPLYHASSALVIGIDRYQSLAPLATAVHGAQTVAAYLRDSFGFQTTELYDDDVTRERVLRWFSKLRPSLDDRVLVYFAGHGVTRQIGQRTEGYLALAQSDGHWNSLAMEDIIDEAEALPAKHVLFLIDACFSGLALRGRGGEFDAERTAEYLLTRQARYAITAGGDEVVDDDAAGEYSLFTHYLLEGLTDPSLAASGLLRARNLALYLEERVSAHRRSRALPNHGYLTGSADGDFLFAWESGPRLPLDLEVALRSDVGEIRWGAAAALIQIVKDETSDLAPIARERLQVLAVQDSDKRVRKAAQSLFDEEEALREAEEERQRQIEADRRLEEARQRQAEAERHLREAEAQMAEAHRRAEEERQLKEAAEASRQQAMDQALQSRQITPQTATGTQQAIPRVSAPAPEASATPRRKLPVWAMALIGLLVIGGISAAVIAALSGGKNADSPPPTEAATSASTQAQVVVPSTEPPPAATTGPGATLIIPVGSDTRSVTTESDPLVYDDFNDPAYDGHYNRDLWDYYPEASPYTSYVQQDGVMIFVTTFGIDAASFLIAADYNDITLDVPTFLEARARLEPGSTGDLSISVQSGGWFTSCVIYQSASAGCFGSYDTGDFWDMGGFDIAVGSWHILRMEIDPSDFSIRYFIDENLVGTESAVVAQNPRFNFSISTYGKHVVAMFDYVRIGPVE